MKNLQIYCITLNPLHKNLIEKLKYVPVGLGNKDFGQGWLQDKTAKRSISSASVWMAVTLFAPTPPCGCRATQWTRPLLPSLRTRWTRSHKERLQGLGEASVTSAETLVETLGARQTPRSVDG